MAKIAVPTAFAAVVFALALTTLAASAAEVRTSHGLSLFGDLKYGPDFTHFDYANPDAPKGGSVKLHAIGTYDSLNPFILKGSPAVALGFLYDTLMDGSLDEASTEYGLVAESADVPDDISWVAFNLRPEARWHDGSPITADDVIFTFETLTQKGHPFYRAYYANVEKAEKLSPHKVKFTFSGPLNRELPTIIGQLVVLPKGYWEGRDFEKTTLEPPMGSGPYRIANVDPGRSISYERVADYWGRDLPVNRGRYNADRLRFDYYRDQTVALEAFKSHGYDFRNENTAKIWATGYDFPAKRAGLVIKEEIENESPTGMQGFVFNIRRDKFKDRALREALAYAFDFEWTNKNLFYGQYTRTKSYFSNSELASSGLPQGGELALLEPYRDKLPPEVFNRPYEAPATDGSGSLRANLRQAKTLLDKAGWKIEDRKLIGPDGAPLEIEILLVTPAFERIAAPMIKNLDRLGVTARLRTVDTSQYQNRLDRFDFDMIVNSWGQSLSPGNEQRNFWSTVSADTPGSRNFIGVKDPVVDALIDQIIFAESRQTLVDATRALDRVLLWGHYVIPQWHIRNFRVAYWNKFGRPKTAPRYALGFDYWWIDAAKAAALDRGEATLD
jgi:microcin C transport system substrate-binding protein